MFVTPVCDLQVGKMPPCSHKALVAAGCLAQRYREEIQEEIPEVDALVGTMAIEEIAQALEEVLRANARNHFRAGQTPPSAPG